MSYDLGHPTFYLSALDFFNSLVWNIEFDELDLFISLNSIILSAVKFKFEID